MTPATLAAMIPATLAAMIPATLPAELMGERQEHLSQLSERRVVWKARVIVNDNSHVLVKCYELLPFGRRFRVPKSNTVGIIFEQINPFKRQSRERGRESV